MFSPTGHHILVQPNDVEEISEGGIVLHSDEMTKKREFFGATRGVVVAIGDMCWKAYDFDKPGWEPWCKVGDDVEFTSNVSKILRDEDDNEFFLMEDICILAVHREET